jgi:hypothetical protein
MQTSKSLLTPINPDVLHKGHMHFFDSVESFHGQHDFPEYEAQHSSLQDKLRNQYLYDNNWE